jgi:hypothetical protein
VVFAENFALLSFVLSGGVVVALPCSSLNYPCLSSLYFVPLNACRLDLHCSLAFGSVPSSVKNVHDNCKMQSCCGF